MSSGWSAQSLGVVDLVIPRSITLSEHEMVDVSYQGKSALCPTTRQTSQITYIFPLACLNHWTHHNYSH